MPFVSALKPYSDNYNGVYITENYPAYTVQQRAELKHLPNVVIECLYIVIDVSNPSLEVAAANRANVYEIIDALKDQLSNVKRVIFGVARFYMDIKLNDTDGGLSKVKDLLAMASLLREIGYTDGIELFKYLVTWSYLDDLAKIYIVLDNELALLSQRRIIEWMIEFMGVADDRRM